MWPSAGFGSVTTQLCLLANFPLLVSRRPSLGVPCRSSDMNATMFQLRSFVHQRLYAAAEEILGEVERTVTLALGGAAVSLFKEGGSLWHQRGLLRNTGDSEVQLTSCSMDHEDEHQGSPTQEESKFILSPEVPGPSGPSTDQDDKTWNLCSAGTEYKLPEIKEEPEEVDGCDQTPDVTFPSAGIVKKEGDPPALQVSYEIPPVSSGCSACLSENSYSDEELVNSAGTTNQNANTLQGQRGNDDQTYQDNQSAKAQKDRSFCHLCGKGFQYIGSLMKHIKTHESKTDCSFCGMALQSTKQLVTHLKGCHNKAYFCDVCGKTFANTQCLRVHERIHTGIKDFVCQECGKTFQRREHLIVHVRTHSGEKPYHCDVCGKAFSQSQNLTIHKRSHSGERPYHCALCGKLFNTSSHLKTHMRYHSGEKPYSCDICGKRFRQSGQVTRHRTTHTGERPYACHLCGMRYRFAPNLKMHLQTHDKAPSE